MKYRPKKDFQLEHMQIFKYPALPHRLTGYSAALPKAFVAK